MYFLLQANLGIAIGSLAIKIKLKPYVYNLHFFMTALMLMLLKNGRKIEVHKIFFFFAHERTFTRQSSLYPFLVHRYFAKKL